MDDVATLAFIRAIRTKGTVSMLMRLNRDQLQLILEKASLFCHDIKCLWERTATVFQTSTPIVSETPDSAQRLGIDDIDYFCRNRVACAEC
jgi:hypothetical protein